MSPQNLTQVQHNIKTKMSRRSVLLQLSTLATAALIVSGAKLLNPGESEPPEVGPADSFELCPPAPAPYGPAERTAELDLWAGRIEVVIVALERYFTFLQAARALPPDRVDGVMLVRLEDEAFQAMNELCGFFETGEDGLIPAACGRTSFGPCVEYSLRRPDRGFDRAFWQREVDEVGAAHPEERARLQAVLNEVFQGVTR